MSTVAQIGGLRFGLGDGLLGAGRAAHSKHGEPEVSCWKSQKIDLLDCSAVQQEFGRTLPLAPKVTLVLGADKNEVWFVGREVRLTTWNRDAFAQGVVWLAFVDLTPLQQRLSITRRAVNWADSTVKVEELKK